MKEFLIAFGFCFIMLLLVIFLLKVLSKQKKEIKQLEKKLEGNKNAKKIKDEIRTGSNSDMFNNSINQLQKYSKKN